MREELIVSGRMNPNIDPVLHIWHWQIPSYLFLGGLAAGIIFFAALYTIQGKEKEYPAAVKWAPFLAPFALIIGLFLLFLDLKHKLYFWQLYTVVRFQSPMSWGAWTLLLITPLSILWTFMYLDDLEELWKNRWPKLAGVVKWLNSLVKSIKGLDNLVKWYSKNRIGMSWLLIILGVILGIYTGILLSAFNARPLWNTGILGPLFMVSGFSTAAATIMWMSRHHDEKEAFGKIDLLLIGVEVFFIIHMFMGFLASTEARINAARLFLGGEFTTAFWVFVVSIGLVIPALLEAMKLRGYKIPVSLPAMMILFGGLIFRFILVEAGQISNYLY